MGEIGWVSLDNVCCIGSGSSSKVNLLLLFVLSGNDLERGVRSSSFFPLVALLREYMLIPPINRIRAPPTPATMPIVKGEKNALTCSEVLVLALALSTGCSSPTKLVDPLMGVPSMKETPTLVARGRADCFLASANSLISGSFCSAITIASRSCSSSGRGRGMVESAAALLSVLSGTRKIASTLLKAKNSRVVSLLTVIVSTFLTWRGTPHKRPSMAPMESAIAFWTAMRRATLSITDTAGPSDDEKSSCCSFCCCCKARRRRRRLDAATSIAMKKEGRGTSMGIDLVRSAGPSSVCPSLVSSSLSLSIPF
mmetsp:Transcript_28457/g.62565  ORF Transcript_28457/g.62565 Transcript_28457/m.62565 type:complete len:311 (+) Transcript_28457:1374-2306(+)